MDASPSRVIPVLADLPPMKEKQEKALTLFRVRAGHNIPQCGLFSGISSNAFSHGHELE